MAASQPAEDVAAEPTTHERLLAFELLPDVPSVRGLRAVLRKLERGAFVFNAQARHRRGARARGRRAIARRKPRDVGECLREVDVAIGMLGGADVAPGGRLHRCARVLVRSAAGSPWRSRARARPAFAGRVDERLQVAKLRHLSGARPPQATDTRPFGAANIVSARLIILFTRWRAPPARGRSPGMPPHRAPPCSRCPPT